VAQHHYQTFGTQGQEHFHADEREHKGETVLEIVEFLVHLGKQKIECSEAEDRKNI
jgi:hypothetical protein